MNIANSGAVFFLGSRAHYQILKPSDNINSDVENGNLAELWSADYVDKNLNRSDGCYDYIIENTGLTRRRRNLSDQIDNDSGEEKECDLSYSSSIKSRNSARGGGCATLRAFIDTLKGSTRHKRRYSNEVLGESSGDVVCTYKDSCRCMECQSRYFECDDDDLSDCSDTSDNSYTDDESEEDYFEQKTPGNIIEMDDFGKQPNKASMNIPLKKGASVVETGELDLEMAAGTPVVLDYILNHPIMCSIQ